MNVPPPKGELQSSGDVPPVLRTPFALARLGSLLFEERDLSPSPSSLAMTPSPEPQEIAPLVVVFYPQLPRPFPPLLFPNRSFIFSTPPPYLRSALNEHSLPAPRI